MLQNNLVIIHKLELDHKLKISALAIFGVVSAQGEEDPIAALEKAIPGSPGEDYPIFATPPETSFLCDGFIHGYYADPEAECQSFHICADPGTGDLTKYSFLCPNGTLFNQQYFICDWWFNVDCSQVMKIKTTTFPELKHLRQRISTA